MRAAAIIGWLVSLGLLLGAAGPLFGTCTQGADGPWIASLIFYGPIGIAGLAIAYFGAPLGRQYLWLAAPHILTFALLVYFIPLYLTNTTISGIPVCNVREGHGIGEPASMLQRLWAPVWVLFTLGLLGVVWQYWRSKAPANPLMQPTGQERSAAD